MGTLENVLNKIQQLYTTTGTTTGAAITTDADGTLQRYARGLVKILGDVWDSVSHSIRVSSVFAGTTTNVAISCAGAGDNDIITPTAGKSLRVVHIGITTAALVDIIFKMAATPLSGAMSITSLSDDGSPYIWAGAVNEKFIMNLSAAIQVSGYVRYYEV